jgi:aconitate hydratase
MLLGIQAVIAESYERIHRSNLIGMGILPLEFTKGENAESLKLTGKEKFTIHLPEELTIGQKIEVTTDEGKKFYVKARIDTEPEIEYFKDGGILNYVMKKLMKEDIKH